MKHFSLTRGEFVKYAAFAGATIVAAPLLGCAPVTPEKNRPLSPEDRLKNTINSLPETAIKQMLVARVLPEYTQPRPASVNMGGESFKFLGASMIEAPVVQRGNAYEFGSVTIRKNWPTMETLYPTQPEKVRVPYIGLFTNQERGQLAIPAENLAQDGSTVLIDVEFLPKDPLYEGIGPEITVRTTDPSIVLPQDQREFLNALEEYARIKEATGLALDHVWVDLVIQKMKELDLNYKFLAKTNTGQQREAEYLIQALTQMSVEQGRMVAVADAAGYIVAMQAIPKHSPILSQLQRIPEFGPVIEDASNLNFGTTPEEILLNSYNWVLTSPNAKRLLTAGSLNQIPMNIRQNIGQKVAIASSNTRIPART